MHFTFCFNVSGIAVYLLVVPLFQKALSHPQLRVKIYDKNKSCLVIWEFEDDIGADLTDNVTAISVPKYPASEIRI